MTVHNSGVNTAPAAEAEQALAAYALEGAHVERAFEVSTRNDNYLVVDSQRDQYVLRRFRRNTDVARVEFQARFEQHLFASGFPTPAVLQTRGGGWCHTVGAFPWVLFGYAPGEFYDFARPLETSEAGRRLAEFHQTSESFAELEPPAELAVPFDDFWTRPDQLLSGLDGFAPGELADEIDSLRVWLEDLSAALPLVERDRLPTGWLHLDFHGRNVHFEGDSIVALFDFDVVQRGPYALDIAHGLFAFGRSARGARGVRPDAALRFLRGYEEVRPIQADERRAVLALMGLDSAPFPAYYSMLERDAEDPVRAIRRDVALVRDRRANARDLEAVLLP